MANNTGQKFGGRTAGTSNKTTAEVREAFATLLQNNFDKIQRDIDLLEPKERISTILQIAKFVIPVLRSVDVMQQEQQEQKLKPIVFQFDFQNDN